MKKIKAITFFIAMGGIVAYLGSASCNGGGGGKTLGSTDSGKVKTKLSPNLPFDVVFPKTPPPLVMETNVRRASTSSRGTHLLP